MVESKITEQGERESGDLHGETQGDSSRGVGVEAVGRLGPEEALVVKRDTGRRSGAASRALALKVRGAGLCDVAVPARVAPPRVGESQTSARRSGGAGHG